MKAADILDAVVLVVISEHNNGTRGLTTPHWAFRTDLERDFPDVPPKVLRAKCRRLIDRGYIDGCACGCRGDFQLLPKGLAALIGKGTLDRPREER